MAAPWHVACLSLDAMMRVVRSAAYATALAGNTEVHFKPYTDSYSAYWLSHAFGRGDPGWYEVDQNDRFIIDRTATCEKRYAATLMQHLAEGPEAAIDYLDQLVRLRTDALARVEVLYRSVRSLNSEIIETNRKIMYGLASVRLAATLAVTAFPAGAILMIGPAGAIAGTALTSLGLVSLGYSVVSAGAREMVAIADPADAKKAAITAVVIEVAKDDSITMSEWMEKLGHMFHMKYSEQLKSAEKIIEQQAKKVATALTASKAAQATRRMTRVEEQAAELAAKLEKAEGAKLLGKGLTRFLPVVFAAIDVHDDIQNFRGN